MHTLKKKNNKKNKEWGAGYPTWANDQISQDLIKGDLQ